MDANNRQKLGVGALTALVVGSMVGGGIFSIPQNTAASAGVGATAVAWAITGVGMLALAFVFLNLARRQPALDSGIYAYARASFGPFTGFSSAWGYWFMAVLGNVGYYVLLFSTLGHYWPVFGDGNTQVAVACASAMLWATHALVLRGVREAALINQVTTLAKLVPLLLFVLLVALAFQPGVFQADVWGRANPQLGGVLEQVRGMMLVTVWVFIGVEGASVYSAHAARRVDVGRATLVGFLFVLALLVAVSLLSMGVMAQPELAGLKNPSMAYVLERAVGPWGADQRGLVHLAVRCALVLADAVGRNPVFGGARRLGPRLAGARERTRRARRLAVADQRLGAAVLAGHAGQRIDLSVLGQPGHGHDPAALHGRRRPCAERGAARRSLCQQRARPAAA